MRTHVAPHTHPDRYDLHSAIPGRRTIALDVGQLPGAVAAERIIEALGYAGRA